MTARGMRQAGAALVLFATGSVPLPAADGDPAAPTSRPADLSESRRNLEEAWITPLESKPGEAGPSPASGLDILRSMKVPDQFVPKMPAEKPEAVPEPARPDKAPETRPATGGLTLLRLRKAPLEGVADPIALADAVFLAGHEAEAARYYKLALSLDPIDADKAWCLYQIGNSLAESDPDAARAMFKRVIAEHSESPWSAPAAAQEAVLGWRQNSRPRELLEGFAAGARTADAEKKDAGATSRPATKTP